MKIKNLKEQEPIVGEKVRIFLEDRWFEAVYVGKTIHTGEFLFEQTIKSLHRYSHSCEMGWSYLPFSEHDGNE